MIDDNDDNVDGKDEDVMLMANMMVQAWGERLTTPTLTMQLRWRRPLTGR